MKIAFNPTTALTSAPQNNDITFDLVGHNIYARGVKFAGTDTTYDVFRKDTSNSTGGRIGLVPVPDYNNNSQTRFLREDGTWANIQVPASITYTFEGGVNSFKVTPSNGTTQTIQITPNVTLNDILCSNYTIATEIKNIATTDTLNSALGKLEYKADLGVTAYSLISAANNGESIDNLAEILKVLEGIKDTETIQAIIGKYLPLTGGIIKNSGANILVINRTDGRPCIRFDYNGSYKGRLGFTTDGDPYVQVGEHPYEIIHSGNIGSQNVESANKLSTARTIWGQSFDGSRDVSGSIYLPNNSQIVWKTSDGASYYNAMYLSASNNLVIGNDIASEGYDTYLSGNNVYLRYGTSRQLGVLLNSSGNVTIGSSDLAGTSAKLYVSGNGKIFAKSKDDIDTRTVGSNNGASVTINTSDTGWLNSGGELRFVLGSDSVVGVIKGKYTTWNQTFNPTTFGSLSFYTRDTTTGNLTERMIIRDNGNVGIGTATPQYKLDVNGTAKISDDLTASSFIKSDSSDLYVLLGGGGHKAISEFMLKSDELTNNLIEIQKTLIVSKDWIDTGIIFNSTTFPTGTGSYMIQLSRDGAYYYTGYLSVVISSDVTRTNTDEIILHGGGFDMRTQYYLRTVQDTDNKVIKLQIARSSTYTVSKTYTFKFKKLI